VKRVFHSAIFWRLAVVALIFLIADLASAPPVLGSGPTLAVTEFNNGAGAPASTIDAMSSALYQSVAQSGKFTQVGGGPLKVDPAMDGSLMGPAINAAQNAGANQVVIADLISASGGSLVYRLSAYRIAPLAFIRDQVFSQSSLSAPALAAGFVSNLNTLYEPRTAIGTIYSVDNGIEADIGAVYGFKLGDEFNVMRDGQKMAQAKLTSIEDDWGTVEIINPVNGYKPQLGDVLVGMQPLPAINPAPRGEPNSFSIIGLLVATGAALLAIGQHGQAAPVSNAPPVSPTPGIGFTVACGTQVGQGTPSQTFTFIFSQQVNTSSVNFSSPSQLYYTTSVSSSQEPLTALGGTQTFDSTGTILTVTGFSLVPTQGITFSFTSGILSTSGTALTPSSCSFTLSTTHHPTAGVHIPLPSTPHNPAKP
jgi:hypothetical protein